MDKMDSRVCGFLHQRIRIHNMDMNVSIPYSISIIIICAHLKYAMTANETIHAKFYTIFFYISKLNLYPFIWNNNSQYYYCYHYLYYNYWESLPMTAFIIGNNKLGMLESILWISVCIRTIGWALKSWILIENLHSMHGHSILY